MTGDDTGDERDRAATVARMLAQRGWPAAQARQAAEGAEMAEHPGDRAFGERVADELDALEARNRFQLIPGGPQALSQVSARSHPCRAGRSRRTAGPVSQVMRRSA